MNEEYERDVKELMKKFPQEAERYARCLREVYGAGGYLDYMRENEAEGLKDCNPYIVKQLSYLEYLMEAVLLEAHRLNSAEMDRDWFVVEWGPGEYKLTDFTSGRFKVIKTYTRKEYEEEVNRRLGYKVY